MDDMNFTEEEIREQLEKLGYYDVPPNRLIEFKKDLQRLVNHERSKNSSWSTCSESTSSEAPDHHHRNPFSDGGNRPKHSNVGYVSYGKENMLYDQGGHHAVVTKSRPGPSTAHNMSVYSTDNDTSPVRHNGVYTDQNDTTLDTTTTSEGRKFIKRRVARKRADGHTEITDELTESEADDMSCLGDRLDDLRLGRPESGRRGAQSAPPPTANYPNHFDPYGHHHHQLQNKNREQQKSAETGRARFGLPEDYQGPTSLIRPMTGDPHTQRIRKADPVARYQKYRQSWESQNAPGEKTHKSLRWNVREQMLYHDPVVQKKSHKVYVPNNYVIPSDKKRKSLRWQVRQDLAQGVIPPSVYD